MGCSLQGTPGPPGDLTQPRSSTMTTRQRHLATIAELWGMPH
jgi:hypothetical protein